MQMPHILKYLNIYLNKCTTNCTILNNLVFSYTIVYRLRIAIQTLNPGHTVYLRPQSVEKHGHSVSNFTRFKK